MIAFSTDNQFSRHLIDEPETAAIVSIVLRAVQDYVSAVRAGVIQRGVLDESRFDENGRLCSLVTKTHRGRNQYRVSCMMHREDFAGLLEYMDKWFCFMALEVGMQCNPTRALAIMRSWDEDNPPPSFAEVRRKSEHLNVGEGE